MGQFRHALERVTHPALKQVRIVFHAPKQGTELLLIDPFYSPKIMLPLGLLDQVLQRCRLIS